MRSAEFKKWYGKDWEYDYTQDLFTDENGVMQKSFGWKYLPDSQYPEPPADALGLMDSFFHWTRRIPAGLYAGQNHMFGKDVLVDDATLGGILKNQKQLFFLYFRYIRYYGPRCLLLVVLSNST